MKLFLMLPLTYISREIRTQNNTPIDVNTLLTAQISNKYEANAPTRYAADIFVIEILSRTAICICILTIAAPMRDHAKAVLQ